MDPVTGTLIGAGANIVGDLFSQSNARDAFQHRYQDTVKDMRAAGLNPALAYGQGGGSPQTMSFGDWGTSAASAAQQFTQAAKTKAETQLLQAQANDLILATKRRAELLGANIENVRSGTDWNTAKTTMANMDITQRKRTLESDIDAALAANLQTQLGTPEARARAKYYRQLGAGAFYLNNAIDVAKAGAQVYGASRLGKNPPIYMRRYR